jgi:hypothetical protein
VSSTDCGNLIDIAKKPKLAIRGPVMDIQKGKSKKSSRYIPIACLILGLATIASDEGVGFIFLLASFISHVLCVTIDAGKNPTVPFSPTHAFKEGEEETSDRDIDMFCVGMVDADKIGRSELIDDGD